MKMYMAANNKITLETEKTYYSDKQNVFHAFISPLELLKNISPTSTFYEVELGTDAVKATVGKSMYISTSARILRKITIEELRANILSKAPENVIRNTENWGVSVNLDDYSYSENTGSKGVAVSNGNATIAKSIAKKDGIAITTGCSSYAQSDGLHAVSLCMDSGSIADCTGRSGIAISIGGVNSIADASGENGMSVADCFGSIADASGESSLCVCRGYSHLSRNSGNHGVALATSLAGSAEASGKDGIAIATGTSGKAKGSLDNWLVLTERDEEGHVLDVQAVQVDGRMIKENTYYILKNGIVREPD